MNWLETLFAAATIYLVVGGIVSLIVFVAVAIFIVRVARDIFKD